MSDHSPELDQLAGALSAVQSEVGAIPKTADNPFFKSKFADLPTVISVASPILTNHGLSISQFPGFDEQGDTLTTWLLHKSGQFICESMRLHSTPGKGQSAVQGLGSAMTYTRRYAYMSVLGLVADEDDDGNGASRPKANSQQRQANGNGNGAPKLATPEDVKEIAAAAKGLDLSQIKLAFGASGVPAVEFYEDVPADKVAPLVKALAEANR